MSQQNSTRALQIEKNELEYAERMHLINFVTPEQAFDLMRKRQKLFDDISGHVEFGFKNTKVDVSRLSPGCQRCGEGNWSCLFINGICNGHCFYCPTRQDEVGVPSTNTVEFPHPEDYVAYIEEFGFTGVSLSGGEPLMTFEKSLDYLRRIKKYFGDRIYFWMYTNGLLLSSEKAKQLRDAGLDEIRFDIGATAYRLDYLKYAVGVIPAVTVEIPAVPEKTELLQQKLREMKDAGVDYLNLHQLRLTPFNFDHLQKRKYMCTHGEKVTVPDSELTALELIRFNVEQEINLPINYCSFVYKNRFQGAGARSRAAVRVLKPWEDITENGYIRSIEVKGEPAVNEKIIHSLQASGVPKWHLQSTTGKLFLSAAVLELLDASALTLAVSYSEASMRQNLSYRQPFVKVDLATGREINIERWLVAKELIISVADFRKMFMDHQPESVSNHQSDTVQIANYEFITAGFADYF